MKLDESEIDLVRPIIALARESAKAVDSEADLDKARLLTSASATEEESATPLTKLGMEVRASVMLLDSVSDLARIVSLDKVSESCGASVKAL